MRRSTRPALAVLLCAVVVAAAPAGLAADEEAFAEAERVVAPSPAAEASWPVPPSQRVLDLEASPAGGEVALLVGPKGGGPGRLLLWRPGSGAAPVEAWAEGPAQGPGTASPSSSAKALTWHPSGKSLFLLVAGGAESRIVRIEPSSASGAGWRATVIHRSKAPLRRLVAGPRPFLIPTDPSGRETRAKVRLFFGVSVPGGAWAIHSVAEDGSREYQVAGPEGTRTKLDTDNGSDEPGGWTVPSALPLSFHPAGHILLWEDGAKGFHAAPYDGRYWGRSSPLWGGTANAPKAPAASAVTGGTVTALPNGRGVLHWVAGREGVTALARGGRERTLLAAGTLFAGTPSFFPDGKAVVGVTKGGAGGAETLRAVPVRMPLADVVNAWMFSEGDEDRLLEANGALFRRLGGDQLYQLYDSELYHCGGYSGTTPTRPYLVTTDVLWEAWAAAYEGLFVLREREEAIPAFWGFVDAAAAELPPAAPGAAGAWGRLFAAARASRDPRTTDAEALRVRAHAGTAASSALGAPFDFAELTPRGHYTGRPASRDYFAAMRYLTAAGQKVGDASPLARLSPAAKAKGAGWIAAYDPFLAPGRSPESLRAGRKVPAWLSHPGKEPVLFPLSFGFDNEVLEATVFHPTWPAAEQVTGPSGPRLVPSGLDVAAAFGSEVASKLLADEARKYPPLGAALERLAARRPAPGAGDSLYERWLEAIGVQWADGPLAGAGSARGVWGVKRLQTGLASWATLRHATVLVNERTVAECGEGGFEELVMRPPRGSVEPDPKSFEAIASLFEAAAGTVERIRGPLAGRLPAAEESRAESPGLREGLLRRLRGAAGKARGFARMAAKGLRGEALTPEEYAEILYVGRAAEHDFLVFKSLANEKLALSTPDPMPKVADVAGGGEVPLLEAAVGVPLEFDLVVPFYGRRQVVRGPVYSYAELTSKSPMTDGAWRKRAASEPLAPWVAPFSTAAKLSCPAKPPF